MKAVILVEESDETLLSFLKNSRIEIVTLFLRFKDHATDYCPAKLGYILNAKEINSKQCLKD